MHAVKDLHARIKAGRPNKFPVKVVWAAKKQANGLFDTDGIAEITLQYCPFFIFVGLRACLHKVTELYTDICCRMIRKTFKYLILALILLMAFRGVLYRWLVTYKEVG